LPIIPGTSPEKNEWMVFLLLARPGDDRTNEGPLTANGTRVKKKQKGATSPLSVSGENIKTSAAGERFQKRTVPKNPGPLIMLPDRRPGGGRK